MPITNDIEVDLGPPEALTFAYVMSRIRARRATVDVAGVPFVFQALGARAFEALAKDHKPTKKQREEYRLAMMAAGLSTGFGPLTYNPETFPAALLSACAVDPVLTVEEAADLVESEALSVGQMADVLSAVLELNLGRAEKVAG